MSRLTVASIAGVLAVITLVFIAFALQAVPSAPLPTQAIVIETPALSRDTELSDVDWDRSLQAVPAYVPPVVKKPEALPKPRVTPPPIQLIGVILDGEHSAAFFAPKTPQRPPTTAKATLVGESVVQAPDFVLVRVTRTEAVVAKNGVEFVIPKQSGDTSIRERSVSFGNPSKTPTSEGR